MNSCSLKLCWNNFVNALLNVAQSRNVKILTEIISQMIPNSRNLQNQRPAEYNCYTILHKKRLKKAPKNSPGRLIEHDENWLADCINSWNRAYFESTFFKQMSHLKWMFSVLLCFDYIVSGALIGCHGDIDFDLSMVYCVFMLSSACRLLIVVV